MFEIFTSSIGHSYHIYDNRYYALIDYALIKLISVYFLIYMHIIFY